MKLSFLAPFLAGALTATTCLPDDQSAEKPVANSQLAQQVSRLVGQLDDDGATERDAVEKKLLDLAGSTAAQCDEFLALLPRDKSQLPLVIRDRLNRIRQQVEDRMAKSVTEQSRITLSASAMPLADVLIAIEKQTGNKFIDNRDELQPEQLPSKVTLDIKDQAFWPAVDEILDQVELGIYSYGGEDALSIVGRSKAESRRAGRADYHGPFRFEALDIRSERNLRQLNQTALKLNLEIAWEPRLRPIAISQPAADVQATTDTGARLTVARPDTIQAVEVPVGTQAAELILPFTLPGRDAKKITQLRGKLRVLVPGRHAKFQFEDLTKALGKTQRLGGIQVTLDNVRKNNAVWEVHMRFALEEANGALQSHRNWVFQNLSYLVDKDGTRIETAGFETTHQSPNEVGVAYVFDVPESLDGLTWVYETPAAIVDLPVEYELKEIDLP